jgi:preprotein translocase subunit SecD
MPRRPRLNLIGIPLHVVQRGVNRGIGIVMAMLVSACQTTNGNKVATPEERVQIAEVFHGKAAETEFQCRDSESHSNPPSFGLDSLGGVHYLLEVDMSSAIIRRLEGIVGDLRGLVRDNSQLRKENVRTTITRDGDTVVLRFSSAAQRTTARAVIQSFTGELHWVERDMGGDDYRLIGNLSAQAKKSIEEFTIKQNISILHNRINPRSETEPVIRQQGANCIVVQLPGVQDATGIQDILTRSVTLVLSLAAGAPGDIQALEVAAGALPPPDTELYFVQRSVLRARRSAQAEEDAAEESIPILLHKKIELTSENLTDAFPSFNQDMRPAVDGLINHT